MDLCVLTVLPLRQMLQVSMLTIYFTDSGQDLPSTVIAMNCFTPNEEFQWGDISGGQFCELILSQPMKKWFTGGLMVFYDPLW